MIKNYLLVLALAYSQIGATQNIAFTDINLKTKLLESSPTSAIARNSTGVNIAIDSNGDQEIDQSEALEVHYLNMGGSITYSANIQNLVGLQYFQNLRELNVSENNIQTLENIYGLINLQDLKFSGNHITNVNLSTLVELQDVQAANSNIYTLILGSLPQLTALKFRFNNVSNLDLSQCPALMTIIAEHNKFAVLDLTHNPQISTVYTGYNNFLTTIYMKNGGSINDPPNIPSVPNLSYICADEEEFPYIESALATVGNTTCVLDDSCSLSNPDFEFSRFLTIYPNPAKQMITIATKSAIELKSIAIYNMLGQQLILVPNAQNNSEVDVSGLQNGSYFISVNSDKGSSSAKFIKQ